MDGWNGTESHISNMGEEDLGFSMLEDCLCFFSFGDFHLVALVMVVSIWEDVNLLLSNRT